MTDEGWSAAGSPQSPLQIRSLCSLSSLCQKQTCKKIVSDTHTPQIYTYEWSASYLLLPVPCMGGLSCLALCLFAIGGLS